MTTDKALPDPGLSSSHDFQIRVIGNLDEHWSDWFDGIELSVGPIGDRLPITTLSCPAMDQARLRGILNKIWDLNLSLLSVQPTTDPLPDRINPKGLTGDSG